MRIKNEEIRINTAGKKFTLHNLILDEYLKLLASHNNNQNIIALDYLLIKFDTDFSDEYFETDAQINVNEFDICVLGATVKKNYDKKRLETTYIYETNGYIWDYFDESSSHHILEYSDRKITAIGFSTAFINKNVMAIINT